MTKSDEFDGTSLNGQLWSVGEPWDVAPGADMGGTGICPKPTPAGLVTVGGGGLHLNATKSTVAGKQMSTCFVTTRDKYSFTHGYLETRVQLPSSPGLWPAFWLLGNGTGSNGWPGTGEIDMFEFVNNGSENGVPFFTVHWAGPCDQWKHCQKTQDAPYPTAVPNYGSRWVTYGIERTSTSLSIYIDGKRTQTFTNTMTNANGQRLPQLLFDNPMHVRFDLSSGGWAQNATTATQPGSFNVDYLRAWQPAAAGTSGTPTTTSPASTGPASTGPTSTPTASGSTTTTNPPVASTGTKCPSSLTDNFTAPTVNSALWPNPSSGVTSGGGRLTIPSTPGYRAVSTPSTLCLTNGQASVQAVSPTSGSDAEADLIVGRDTANSVTLLRTGRAMVFRQTLNGVTTDTSAPFSPTTQAYWRIRSSNGTISWQTSADGATWRTERSNAATLDLSHAFVMLRSGSWSSAAAGPSVFGPVKVGPSV